MSLDGLLRLLWRLIWAFTGAHALAGDPAWRQWLFDGVTRCYFIAGRPFSGITRHGRIAVTCCCSYWCESLVWYLGTDLFYPPTPEQLKAALLINQPLFCAGRAGGYSDGLQILAACHGGKQQPLRFLQGNEQW